MTDKKNNKMSASETKKEDWMNSKWRPAMGWMYMAVCIFDFILAPILWAGIQFWETQTANDAFRQWQPLTLQGAGLFHMAMGAVLGLSAWGRTQEKLGGANNGGINLSPNVDTTYTPQGTIQQPGSGGFGAPNSAWGTSSPGYGAVPPATGLGGNTGFGAPAPGFGTQSATVTVTTGWGGKKAVPHFDQPEI